MFRILKQPFAFKHQDVTLVIRQLNLKLESEDCTSRFYWFDFINQGHKFLDFIG